VPDSPILLNWLSSSYQKVGDVENARRIACRNYQRNPDYLFAKVGHAHFLLLENDLSGFEQVFDRKYDLKLLYPERTAFHVSEFVSLYGVVIEYLIRTKDLERAELLYDSMAQVAPDAGMTKRIHDLLLSATMLGIMERMEERLRKPRKPRKPRAKKPSSSSPPPPPPA
jgi:hypothetical protein